MQKHQCLSIVLLLLLCQVSTIWAAPPLDGDWVGGFERPESYVYVHTHFETTATNGTTGTIDVVDLGGRATLSLGWALDKLELNQSRARFELANKPGPRSSVYVASGPISFEGQVTNGVMTGVVDDSGMKSPFHLDLMAKVDPLRYVGIYQAGPGHYISITPPGSFYVSLSAVDISSGEGGILVPRSGVDFICGAGLKVRPVRAILHFTTNQLGEVIGLQWKPVDGQALAGTRTKALLTEEISMTNGATTLAGAVVLPPTKGPHPAIVLIHGSGPGARGDLRILADLFALNGVAALIYDKRGCGASTGDWRKSTFEDLARDALVGLELLKKRPDINPHQIGVWGTSEGGWIAPLAAALSSDIAFVISVSGPGITPAEIVAYQVEHWMKTAGYADADVKEARSLSLSVSHCRVTDSGWNELEAARKAAQNKPWYNANPCLDRGAPGVDTLSQLRGNYDPVPTLRKVHCPVLSVYGELDSFVPARQSAEIWKAALAEAGNRDVVIKVFPNANHSITDPRTGTPVAAYLALQRDWLLKHVTVTD